MNEKKRETFTSSAGFVLACIGSAIGLGNIWMFPYRLGMYGGAAFFIPYLFFVLVLGRTGLIMEFSFGRHFAGGSMVGIRKIFKEKGLKGGTVCGALPAIGLGGIFIFYNIVVGWILKYLFMSVTGEIYRIDRSTYFESFAGTAKAIPWTLLSVAIIMGIIALGVTKGIERINNLIMPALFVIFIALAIRSLTLPGATKGVAFLVSPNWKALTHVQTWIMALGQAFFTVSLNGCGMVVYGSYLKKDSDISRLATATVVLDTAAALLAAFVIVPAAFAFDVDMNAGPMLLFMTMPSIFEGMAGGHVIGVIFFVSILFAAISSSINMLEGVTEAVISNFDISRKKAAVLSGGVMAFITVPLNLSMNAFDSFTNFVTIVVSPSMVLLVAILFYHVYDSRKAMAEIETGSKSQAGIGFENFSKYGFSAVTLLIIVLGICYGGIG